MKFRPLGDRIVVIPNDPEELSGGGIYIPPTAIKEQMNDGEVVAIGPGRRADDGSRVESELKLGDQIWFNRYVGTEIILQGDKFPRYRKYLVMEEGDAVVVFEPS